MRDEAGCLASGKLFTRVASFSVSGEFVFLGAISHPLLTEEADAPWEAELRGFGRLAVGKRQPWS